MATLFWEEGMEEIWTGVNFPMNYRTVFLNRFLSSDSEYGEYPWHVGILSSLGQVIYKLKIRISCIAYRVAPLNICVAEHLLTLNTF